MQEGQTYSGIASAGNPAVSNISEIDTGANYVSGTNSSGLNVVSLGTDGSTSLVMSAYAPATHDCWTIIDLKAPATIWGQSLDMGTYYALDANVEVTDCEATNILPTTGTVTLPEQGGFPKRLLEYLDEDDELRLDAVKRLRFYTSALLEGSITPDHVMEDWPDWYQLVPAFVATYGTDELQELEGGSAPRSDRGAGRRDPHRSRPGLPQGAGNVARHVSRDEDRVGERAWRRRADRPARRPHGESTVPEPFGVPSALRPASLTSRAEQIIGAN